MAINYYNSAFTGEEIDAAIGGAVRGDIEQTKDAAWKTQALNNISSTGLFWGGSLNSSDELTLSFSGAVRFVLLISGSSATRQGAAIVYGTATGTAVVSPIGTLGSALTITPGRGSITISSSSSSSATSVIALCLTGATLGRLSVS